MEKSAEAFRTISEVAEILDTPAHVLRFWESRFPQIRPVKRAGGRRYYRPADVALLAGIRRLLHDEGMTIRGVQKILREQGVRHVAGLGGHDPGPAPADEAQAAEAQAGFAYEEPQEPRGEIVPFAREIQRAPSLRAEALPRPPFPAGTRPAAGGAPDTGPAVTGTPDASMPQRTPEAEETPSGAVATTAPADHPEAVESAPIEAAAPARTTRPPVADAPVTAPAERAATVDSAAVEATPAARTIRPPVPDAQPADRTDAGGSAPVEMPSAAEAIHPAVPEEQADKGTAPAWSPPAPLVPRDATTVSVEAAGRMPVRGQQAAEPDAAPAPSGEAVPAPVDADAGPEPEETVSWRPALLRALPPRALAHRRAEVARLRHRLLDLRERLRSEGEEPRG